MSNNLYCGNNSSLTQYLNKSDIESQTNGALKFVSTIQSKNFIFNNDYTFTSSELTIAVVNEPMTLFDTNNLYPLWYMSINSKVDGYFNVDGGTSTQLNTYIRINKPTYYSTYIAGKSGSETINSNTTNITQTMNNINGSFDIASTDLNYYISFATNRAMTVHINSNITIQTTIQALCVNTSLFA